MKLQICKKKIFYLIAQVYFMYPYRWVTDFSSYPNDYFNSHTCLSIHLFMHFCPCVQKTNSNSALMSLNVTNKSFLICVKREKYAFLGTTTPLGSMRWGEAELHTFRHQERRSQATYTKTSFSVSSPPQCLSQASCVC